MCIRDRSYTVQNNTYWKRKKTIKLSEKTIFKLETAEATDNGSLAVTLQSSSSLSTYKKVFVFNTMDAGNCCLVTEITNIRVRKICGNSLACTVK